ncbi:MAG: hypothetical protein E7L17_12610 [Clostridium sp.]|uniref:hypothetical protein n=1 Tax=Clostridium sp. TaxID=1506 RepID=UPI0029061F8C|nr:hypothetical protein [Clostridium sp.]MDU7338945.1 hypothetical protein [Clostridium sp.]
MKKRNRLVYVVLAIILVESIGVGIYINYGRDYFRVFRLNWNISLPTNAKQLYEMQSEANIHGDGERYHVFQYDKTPDFPAEMVPVTTVSQEEREDVYKILSSGITVEEKYLPDFDGVTLRIKAVKKGSTRMYLYYVESSQTLYIIEHFI